MTEKRLDNLHRRISPAIPLAVGIACAIVAVAFSYSAGSSSKAGPIASGYTFDQAAAKVAPTVANASGGPWRLFSAVGIVTSGLVSPEPDTTPAGACQGLPGPTVWNSSRIPVWKGALNAGISPFWELLFISTSGAILPIQTVNDSVMEDPPISPDTPCGIALSAIGGRNYSLLSSPTVNVSFDSDVTANLAWTHGGSQFVKANPRIVEYLSAGGPQPLYGVPWSVTGTGWGLVYGTCGIPGIHGNANESDFFIPNATSVGSSTGNATCTWSHYTISFGSPSNSSGPDGGIWVSIPIMNVAHNVSLNSWMFSLTVTNSSGSRQPVANVTCGASFGPESCRAETPGWFAALTTDTGYWLDVFGWNASGPGWRLPNVGVYANDTLTVYLPSSLATASLTISTVSTLSSIEISGSARI